MTHEKTEKCNASCYHCGIIFSFVFLGERPTIRFYPALVCVMVATVIMVKDTLKENEEKT